MDVTSLVSQLRAAVEGARSMPMSSSAVIHRPEILRLLESLERALPEAFADSARVVSRRDSVVADAQRRGDRILEEARNERDRLLSETEVYRIARREADTLRADVRHECEELRRETDEYVDARLAHLEITLTKTLEAVSRGRDRLKERTELDPESLDSLAAAQPSPESPSPPHERRRAESLRAAPLPGR